MNNIHMICNCEHSSYNHGCPVHYTGIYARNDQKIVIEVLTERIERLEEKISELEFKLLD